MVNFTENSLRPLKAMPLKVNPVQLANSACKILLTKFKAQIHRPGKEHSYETCIAAVFHYNGIDNILFL